MVCVVFKLQIPFIQYLKLQPPALWVLSGQDTKTGVLISTASYSSVQTACARHIERLSVPKKEIFQG